MDLTQLANLGEFIGGVAVLVTLIYLAVQIRHNTKALRFSAAHEMVGQSDLYTTLLIENPEAFRIWRESIVTDGLEDLENPDQLNPEDLHMLNLLLYKALFEYASQWDSWQTGALADQVWARAVLGMRIYLASPASLDWWHRLGRHLFDNEYVDFVDKLIAKPALRQ